MLGTHELATINTSRYLLLVVPSPLAKVGDHFTESVPISGQLEQICCSWNPSPLANVEEPGNSLSSHASSSGNLPHHDGLQQLVLRVTHDMPKVGDLPDLHSVQQLAGQTIRLQDEIVAQPGGPRNLEHPADKPHLKGF